LVKGLKVEDSSRMEGSRVSGKGSKKSKKKKS